MKYTKFPKSILLGMAVTAMSLSFAACNNEGERDNVDVTVNDNRDTAAYQTSDTWIRERDDYRTNVRSRYDTMQNRYRNWSNEAGNDTREFRNGFERRMDTLGQQLNRLGNAAESEWQELKNDIDRGINRAERDWDSVNTRRNNNR